MLSTDEVSKGLVKREEYMNTNLNRSIKVVAFLFIVFLSSLSFNKANAQGPNAPEAASFEPVDATDMVNLVTGNMSYVLPLLNVPSPEGGYPIALSYHAGIAMDQEASWVGLGWSLNPGTINRGVNGYPDDWGKTNVNEFFYDAGWEEDYYSFSAGVTLNGSVSVGIGLSWGSNQSLGGYVSASIGLGGENGASIGGYIGTNGVGINAGYAGFSASIGTNGVGVGYGTKGDTSIGVSLNYNYSSGLSGGISITQKNGTFGGKPESKGGIAKTSGLGINFSSQGVSVNAKVNGYGAGISTASYGVNSSDYDITVSSNNFFLPVYIFYVGFGHTNVKYSLYKYNNLYTSGMLYPVVSNKLKPYSNSTDLSRLLFENNFMDVNILPKYNDEMAFDDLLELTDQVDKNNLLLPNYDNYNVSAQGLSGTLSPYHHTELNLSGRGRGEQNSDHIYAAYLNNSYEEYTSAPSSGIDVNRDAIKRVNFTMDNVYNSFLRMERTNIYKPSYLTDENINDINVLKHFETSETHIYRNSNLNSLSSDYEAKKREGNYIRTFTNKEIKDSYVNGVSTLPGFIDAIEYNSQNTEIHLDRSDSETFLDEGIGAYQITTPDGRTYHYSLPVYQFESFYKNFKKEFNEDENFFEIQKTTPYATHWLLTAITGPDYLDKNGNGKFDQYDYGYWVSFDYGKWSDGYIWQTPNERFKIDENKSSDKTYSYTWGRKQIYYLDAIKTRTHTALFVKNLRLDNKSKGKYLVNQSNQWQPGIAFDPDLYGKIISKVRRSEISPENTLYDISGEMVALPSKHNCQGVDFQIDNFSGNQREVKYYNIPGSYTIKLNKIILLKSNVGYEKQRGNLINNDLGYAHSNNYYDTVTSHSKDDEGVYCNAASSYGNLYSRPVKLIEFNIQDHQKILDIKDIEGLGLEEKASQVIDFDYDYSLAKGTSNSEAENQGRLTLKAVNFKGKKGVQIIPPYKFDYLNEYTQFKPDDIDDWGYHKTNPKIWSLNQITTPTGGKIKIEHEPDAYYAEAAYTEEIPYNNLSTVQLLNGNTKIIFKDGSPEVLSHFIKNRYYKVKYTELEFDIDRGGPPQLRSVSYDRAHKVLDLGVDWVIFDVALGDYDSDNQCEPSNGTTCRKGIVIYGKYQPKLTDVNTGGGIRTKSITVSDGTNDIVKTNYKYAGGITSYAPSDDPKGIPYVSELPAPLVMYGTVTMENVDRNDNLLGSTKYKFETLEPYSASDDYIFSIGDAFKVKENQDEWFNSNKVKANKYTLYNRLGNVGRLLSVTSYNNLGQKLNTNENHYKTDLDEDGEIGVTQETHKSVKKSCKNHKFR